MGDLIDRDKIYEAVYDLACKSAGVIGGISEDYAYGLREAAHMIEEAQAVDAVPMEALSAALHRAEPEMRPLTLEELKAHCAKGRDAEPLWVEFDTVIDMALWVLANTPCGMDEKDIPSLAYWVKDEELVSKYGKFWRCGSRKPTPEQMAAEKWEE